MNLFKTCFLALLVPVFLAAQAIGATITWDTSAYQVNASDPTQISTAGTLLTAVAFSSSAGYGGLGPQLVNTVTFNSNTITTSPAAVSANASIGFEAGGIVGGSSSPNAYLNLFEGTVYLNSINSATHAIVLSGLTSGQTYQLQFWSGYWSANYQVRLSDTAPTFSGGLWNSTNQSQTLISAASNSTQTPQYTFGTFTASGTTQNIFWYGELPGINQYAVLGAFQVRAVPEPTTVALLSLGVLGLIVRRRFRRPTLAA